MTTASAILKSVFGPYIAARERQAERYVAGFLLTADDATLRSYGYSRAELRKRASAAYL